MQEQCIIFDNNYNTTNTMLYTFFNDVMFKINNDNDAISIYTCICVAFEQLLYSTCSLANTHNTMDTHNIIHLCTCIICTSIWYVLVWMGLALTAYQWKFSTIIGHLIWLDSQQKDRLVNITSYSVFPDIAACLVWSIATLTTTYIQYWLVVYYYTHHNQTTWKYNT